LKRQKEMSMGVSGLTCWLDNLIASIKDPFLTQMPTDTYINVHR
jgi:hypothetical protein